MKKMCWFHSFENVTNTDQSSQYITTFETSIQKLHNEVHPMIIVGSKNEYHHGTQ